MEGNPNFINLSGRSNRTREDTRNSHKHKPKPAPLNPEEKQARNAQRKENVLKNRLAKKQRRAAADQPIAGKDGEFHGDEQCVMCLQKGHIKKQCPLPRKEARNRQHDLLTEEYRERKEKARLHPEQAATAAGKDFQFADNAAVRHQRKLTKRAARQEAKSSVVEAGEV